MSTEKTLADVQPGGRVRLGDQLPPLPASSAHCPATGEPLFSVAKMKLYAQSALSAQPSPGGQGGLNYERMFVDACAALAEVSRELGCDPELGGAEPILAAIAELREALAASQPVRIYGCCAQPEGDLHTAECPNMRHLAARQPVGEPVTDAGRTVAYDAIDRFLRNNMDDAAYADYVEHLEALWAAVPAQAVDLGKYRHALLRASGWARRSDVTSHAEDAGLLRELLALIDSDAKAQAVDLGQFRQPVQDWLDDAQASMEEHGDYDGVLGHVIEEGTRLLGLIDSHSAGGQP